MAIPLGVALADAGAAIGVVVGLVTRDLLGHAFRPRWAIAVGLAHACLLAQGGVFLGVRLAKVRNALQGGFCGGAIVAIMWLLVAALTLATGAPPDWTLTRWAAALGVFGVVHGALGGIQCGVPWRAGLMAVPVWLGFSYLCADIGSLGGGADESVFRIVSRRLRGGTEGPSGLSLSSEIGMAKGAALGAACGGALGIAVGLAAMACLCGPPPHRPRRIRGAGPVGAWDTTGARRQGDGPRVPSPRRLGLSWRGVTVFVVLAAGAAVFAVTVQHAATKREAAAEGQREAAAALHDLGAKLDYDSRGNVVIVSLERSHVTDADLPLLSRLPRLESLSLLQSRITPAGLVHLRPLRMLRAMSVHDWQVTEVTVEDLRCLTNLQRISVCGGTPPPLHALRREFFWLHVVHLNNCGK